jgi:hypothetical protein
MPSRATRMVTRLFVCGCNPDVTGEWGLKGMLKFELPVYEAKNPHDDKWVEISEIHLMDQLYRTYHKVTPAIKEMIKGNEVETPHGTYRLKLKGGVKDIERPELTAA